MENTTPASDNPLADALRHLRRARDARARGGREAIECVASAETAYLVAQDAYFAVRETEEMATAVEVMYQAKACVGRMHRFRGEHEPALMYYRGALAVVEEYQKDVPAVKKWLGPAYHDCYVESRLCGHVPAEYRSWATARMDLSDEDERYFAFTHDLAYLSTSAHSREPRHLWNAAVASTFYTEEAFDRMIIYANMCLASGQMQNARSFGRALHRFDAAVDRMEHEEGLATALLDVAGGAFGLGERRLARERLMLAERVAEQRLEEELVKRAHHQRVAYGLREDAA